MEIQKSVQSEDLKQQIAITDAYVIICQDKDITEALEQIPRESRELIRWVTVMAYIKGQNNLIAETKKLVH